MGHDKLFHKRKVLTRLEKTRKLRRFLIVCEGEMYKLLEKRQGIAIHNARKLYMIKYKQPLSGQNPVTTVFKLVERLTQ